MRHNKEIEHDTYCKECGEPLFSFPCEAETVRVYHYDSGGGTTYRLASPYDGEGNRQYAEVYQCPNFKKRFILGDNGHSQFAVYKNEVIYCEPI